MSAYGRNKSNKEEINTSVQCAASFVLFFIFHNFISLILEFSEKNKLLYEIVFEDFSHF